MMRYLSITMLLVGLDLVASAQNGLGDFFPLALGLSRTYEFHNEEKTYESLIQLTHTKDSGLVRFVVDDLQYTDSTIVWSITQVQTLVRQFENIALSLPETTYFIQDTLGFEMIEWREGNHLLKSPGFVNRAWQFPRGWFAVNNSWSWTIDPAIFRYAPATWRHVIKSDSVIASVWIYSDSLSFREGVGLEYYESRTRKGPNTPYYLETSARLVDPVLSVAGQGAFAGERRMSVAIFPNPFNSSTQILVTTDARQLLSIELYDILGRHVAQLYDGQLDPGQHSFRWNGHGFPSGVYFCTLATAGEVVIQKLLLAQ